jgi:hypothetical protein
MNKTTAREGEVNTHSGLTTKNYEGVFNGYQDNSSNAG